MRKTKISAFEYAIMEIASPEDAKNYEPFTHQEEINNREENLIIQAKELKVVESNHKINIDDIFYVNGAKYKCVGHDDGKIWGVTDKFSESIPFDYYSCNKKSEFKIQP